MHIPIPTLYVFYSNPYGFSFLFSKVTHFAPDYIISNISRICKVILSYEESIASPRRQFNSDAFVNLQNTVAFTFPVAFTFKMKAELNKVQLSL
jgi:hypothetical protein